MDAIAAQPRNTRRPIERTDAGSDIAVRAEHSSKALSPMLVTLFGTTTTGRDLHLAQSIRSIKVSALGSARDARRAQPLKAPTPIDEMVLGIVMDER